MPDQNEKARAALLDSLPYGREEIDRILSALTAAGLAVVPVEPSDRMVAAALESSIAIMDATSTDRLLPHHPNASEVTRRAWAAMLAAAAPAPAQTEETPDA